MKSSPDQIRQRFDLDVERFANLDTGQSATIDAPLVLELIAEAATAVTPQPRHVLDVGCGAGNYTLKLLSRLTGTGPTAAAAPTVPAVDVTLIDLSRPMLDRATQRIAAATAGTIITLQGDVRALDLGQGTFDIILAAAVLHHLRGEDEWRAVFAAFRRCLRPGGSLWVSDLIEHGHPALQAMMRRRYGEYLSALKGGGSAGEAYRDHVFDYIEQEDSPRPLMFQLDLLREAGFGRVEILHKNSVFAAYGAM